MDKSKTIVILLFGLKLIKVVISEERHLPELLHDILNSGDYDIPKEIHLIMQKYTTRQLRYITFLHPIPIHDLQDPPKVQELTGFINLEPDSGLAHSRECTRSRLPSDGSCLNLIIEEPLPLEQLEVDERLRSREVILFLNRFGVNIFCPLSTFAPGYKGNNPKANRVWCKLVHQRELDIFTSLEPHNPGAHHIVALLLPPYPLPATDQYLITMPDYGIDLETVIRLNKDDHFLAGPQVVCTIAHQLCEAIGFLHSHDTYHPDIKPQNVVIDPETCHLTVIDLGWSMQGSQPCQVSGGTGTYQFAPPEVQRWYEWEKILPEDMIMFGSEQYWKERAAEEEEEEKESPQVYAEEGVEPEGYDPQRADSWAVGNVIRTLLYAESYARDWDELHDFSLWLKRERPNMDEALKWLDSDFGRDLPPIEEEENEIFRSEEITLFLNQFGYKVLPSGYPLSTVAPGYKEDDPIANHVWFKVVHQAELDAFTFLEPHDPGAHHVAALLLPPHRLGTDQYLITVPNYGIDLETVIEKNWELNASFPLLGTAIYKIARQLCEAISFLHSHDLYHLDVNPQNIVIHPRTHQLTLIDLGWTMLCRQPYLDFATGTYEFVAPEVQRWHEWEEIQLGDNLDSIAEPRSWKEDDAAEGGREESSQSDTEEAVEPERYNPQRADSWAIGNVIHILLQVGYGDSWDQIEAFSVWMMEERPKMDEALKRLDTNPGGW
ncbi:hypothetical protein E1B28_011016 [Marasmius oreades]|uniref:Protein kinase domain-containing protein n=1 Tax=Marasmius oreades TaxID=181124 RepID=A0A9P7RT70_9AGAR|nr:uncharacterized protein E1B28_011016 [Marasmius oreades]KAG7089319.1 hypothetical protein E1B28_011016 [Marasmius oreades]